MTNDKRECNNCEMSICGYPINGTVKDISIYCDKDRKCIEVEQDHTCDSHSFYVDHDISENAGSLK